MTFFDLFSIFSVLFENQFYFLLNLNISINQRGYKTVVFKYSTIDIPSFLPHHPSNSFKNCLSSSSASGVVPCS